MVNLTKKKIDGLKPRNSYYRVWDNSLTGFGIKVTPTGSKIYIAKYRIGGILRWYTIGKHGVVTPDEARKEAKRILGDVARGIDPQALKTDDRKALTITELCDVYLKEGCATKKPSTIATDTGRIERHIKPLLGRKRVKDLTHNDVRRFLADIAAGKTATRVKTGKNGLARVTGGKGTATRTVGLLGGIMSFAVQEGLRSDNPVRGVKRYPDKKQERFLSLTEMKKLGEILKITEDEQSEYLYATAAIRLLLLTGCRKNEVLSLTWPEVDFNFGCLRLKDSKTGQKIVPLGAPALETLEALPRLDECDYVFPAQKGDGHYVGLPKAWLRIRHRAGLDDVRLHDLRHSFASVGAGAGMGLQVVGKLLGHADPKTTARYAHIADDPAKVAADRISGTIAGALEGKKGNVVRIKQGG